jgi:hypothetical protein
MKFNSKQRLLPAQTEVARGRIMGMLEGQLLC